jgi:hypothetical protein
MSLEAILELVVDGVPPEEAIARCCPLESDPGPDNFAFAAPDRYVSSSESSASLGVEMICDCWARVDPLCFEGFTLGRPYEELRGGLIFLNLWEWRWLRRSMGSNPPPPVLVWMPPIGDERPEWSGLRDVAYATQRFPQ